MTTKFVIHHSPILKGEVKIQGAKNAAQKIIPATIVFPGEYLLRNVPKINDSAALVEILSFLGAKINSLDEHTLLIDTTNIEPQEIPPEVTAKSTGSFLFAGALLSRFGSARIWHPGGDQIGRRKVTWHLDAFRRLGATVIEKDEYYEITSKGLTGGIITFTKTTVNGTVNAILASICAKGTTIIQNSALEPEIDNFILFMQQAGANVKRGENGIVEVQGVSGEYSPVNVDITIMPDRNDAATFVIAGALGHGPITLKGVNEEHLLPLLAILSQKGVRFELGHEGESQILEVQCSDFKLTGLSVTSRPYPGFSTDWGPMLEVLMTQMHGVSVFHETIFSQRFTHLDELKKMGAKIEYFNPDVDPKIYNFPYESTAGLFHAVKIYGPTKLNGTVVSASDVRAGAALVIAGLVASDITEVLNIEQIERGYESFDERLNGVGAVIQRV